MAGEYTDIPSLYERWGGFWQNQQKQDAEQAAGKRAAAGDWAGAQKEALGRGQLPLYNDMHTAYQRNQLELAQKVLDVALSTQNKDQWNATLDLLQQHGVAVSKYRIPADGDYETVRNAALSELGGYTSFLKSKEEQATAEANRRKAAYQGVLTVPGVSREVPTQLPQTMGAASPTPFSAAAPGVSMTEATPPVQEAAQEPSPAPLALDDVMKRLRTEMAGRGVPTPTHTETTPEQRYAMSIGQQGQPVLAPLPEGAEMEGKGSAAKDPLEVQIFNSLKGDAIKNGTYTSDAAIWDAVAANRAKGKSSGGGKEAAALQAAKSLMEDAESMGEPISFEDAYNKVKAAGFKPSSFAEQKKYFAEVYPNKTPAEILDLVKDFNQKTTGAERELGRVAKENGVSSLKARELLEKAKTAGKTTPEVVVTTGKDAAGNDVDGMMFINHITQKAEFAPFPPGVKDVHKISASTGRANAELEEIEKIKKENPGISTEDAIRRRADATTHPSAEMQGLMAIRKPGEDLAVTAERWTKIHTKPTDHERLIADIVTNHPGTTREDAELRAKLLNQATILKQDPSTGKWIAEPLEGSLALRKLETGKTTDLQAYAKALKKFPGNETKTDAELMTLANSVLKNKGFTTHLDSSGNPVYQIAENSAAEMQQEKISIAREMADLKKRVATDPVLAGEMKWATEAAKNNVKTEGREAQTAVVDNHIKGIEELAGTLNPRTPEEVKRRADLERAMGFLKGKLRYDVLAGMFIPDTKVSQAAQSLLSYKYALQAETSRLLSMGMTGNIAHEHAKELGQVVGELQELPSVSALLNKLEQVKKITAAIRTLPQIPTDPIEAQRGVMGRLSSAPTENPMIKELAAGAGVVVHDGKAYRKSLSDDGAKVIWREMEAPKTGTATP